MTPNEKETLLEFPCEFTVKAMGLDSEDFQDLAEAIVSRHLEEGAALSSHTNNSRNRKYLSVSVTFTAHSKQQLDAIYMDLTSEPRVLVAL